MSGKDYNHDEGWLDGDQLTVHLSPIDRSRLMRLVEDWGVPPEVAACQAIATQAFLNHLLFQGHDILARPISGRPRRIHFPYWPGGGHR